MSVILAILLCVVIGLQLLLLHRIRRANIEYRALLEQYQKLIRDLDELENSLRGGLPWMTFDGSIAPNKMH